MFTASSILLILDATIYNFFAVPMQTDSLSAFSAGLLFLGGFFLSTNNGIFRIAVLKKAKRSQ